MKRSTKGFALVDVLVAVVVLAIGISFLTSLQRSSNRNIRLASEMTNAAYIAEEVKDDLRTPGSNFRLDENGKQEGNVARGGVTYKWQADRVKAGERVDQVRIQLSWKDLHAGEHQQEFSTSLPKR